MHILEELWNGNLCPISQDDYRTDDYRNLLLLYQRNEEKLLTTLNDTQKEYIQKQQDLIDEMRNITECNAFISGFRLAVQLMAASVSC